jgi:hypothetical protein
VIATPVSSGATNVDTRDDECRDLLDALASVISRITSAASFRRR